MSEGGRGEAVTDADDGILAEGQRRIEINRSIAGGKGGAHEGWWLAGFVKGAEWERGQVLPLLEALRLAVTRMRDSQDTPLTWADELDDAIEAYAPAPPPQSPSLNNEGENA